MGVVREGNREYLGLGCEGGKMGVWGREIENVWVG